MKIEYSLDDIDKVAKKIIDYSEHRIILFEGNLGAGKTTLIKALVKALGSSDYVSSPTFSLLNEYETESGEPIYHMDLYRLKDEQEAFDIGIEELLENNFWKFIEWPEKINTLLDSNYHSANILSINEKKRFLELK